MTRLLLARKRLYELLKLGRERNCVMVNIGGGLFFRPNWMVLDHVSPFYPFARRYIDHELDLVGPLRFPFADNSVDFFYSAHTFEHIPQENCSGLLVEIHRCLRKGGAFRISVPDYDLMRQAAADRDDEYHATVRERNLTFEQAVVEQVSTAMLDIRAADRIAKDYANMSAEAFADEYCAASPREIHKNVAGNHINWFNYDKMARMLNEAGFRDVYRSSAQASRFEQLRGEGGWLSCFRAFEFDRMLGLDTTWPEKSLYVEAVK